MPTKIHAPDKQRNRYLAQMHSSPQIIRSQKNTLNREGASTLQHYRKKYAPHLLSYYVFLQPTVSYVHYGPGVPLLPREHFASTLDFSFQNNFSLVLTNISKHSSSHSQHKREKSNTWAGKTPLTTDRDFWPLSDVGTFST